jgi:Zn-dependent metalloprotease
MRARRAIAGAAVLAAALIGNQAVSADPGTQLALDPTVNSLVGQTVTELLDGIRVNVMRDSRGLAHSVGALAEQLIPLPAGTRAQDPEARARAHLTRVGPLFGLTDGVRELALLPQAEGLPDDPRDVFVRFQQLRGGLPVLGGELSVVLDRVSGGLRSVTGELLPAGVAPGRATVDAAKARETALDLVARRNKDTPRSALEASKPELMWLDPALVGLPARLGIRAGKVWRVEVADGGLIRHSVLVDADTGRIAFDWNMITTLVQVVCDLQNKPSNEWNGPDCKKGSYLTTRAPGSDAAEGWDNTVRASKFYEKYVNIDLTKLIGSDLGDGKKLRSTVRFCPANEECALGPSGGLLSNAFWNGKGMYYGDGWTAGDDIVAHELTHGVTEKTSRLLYFYQSGAINEAMSDIFGEIADLTNGYDGPNPQTDWVIGEDAPLTTLPLRVMSNPLLTINPAQPDRMTSAVYDADLAFVDNGGVHTNSGVGNKAAYLLGTGEDFNGQTITKIGYTKISVLFYRVQRMLTSGADYRDLAAAMKQGCSDLIGTNGFKSTTCQEVSDVIAATEMTQQPTVELAAAPEAPYCPSGLRGDYVLMDSFEKLSSKRWKLGTQWLQIDEYAEHGRKSVWGIEADFKSDSSLYLNDYIPIPRGVSSFLRFDHQYRLDAAPYGPYYDGVRVEYREPGGSWKALTSFPWENGPTKTITPEGGTSYTGFGGNSAGYTSSRVDLSKLAGKKIQVRWRMLSDKQIAYDGWTVDDVRFLTCGKDLPSSVGTAKITPGKGTLRIAWTPPPYVPSGGISKYRVEFVGRGSRTTKPTTLSTTFGDLKKGKKYTIKVTAYNKAGQPGPTATRHGYPK